MIHSTTPIHVLIEGEASGADTMAREWALKTEARYLPDRKIKVDKYKADWVKYDRAAGPIRNSEMLKEGKPDMAVAFHDDLYRPKCGTRDMVEKLKSAGVKVVLVSHNANGDIQMESITTNIIPKVSPKGWVIYSEEAGVYLGSCMGMGFWSKMDPVGQDAAAVFPTVNDINAYVQSVDNPANFPKFTAVQVEIDVNEQWASIQSCVNAGLPAWNPKS
jgi:hypothetical protein